MMAYYCSKCVLYFREAELTRGRCPECGGNTKPRLILGGQVMGDAT